MDLLHAVIVRPRVKGAHRRAAKAMAVSPDDLFGYAVSDRVWSLGHLQSVIAPQMSPRVRLTIQIALVLRFETQEADSGRTILRSINSSSIEAGDVPATTSTSKPIPTFPYHTRRGTLTCQHTSFAAEQPR
jgi:hypothetical protein